jgi:hypothetical protein
MTSSMITITNKCGHHRDDLNAVVLLVIAGEISERTAFQCPSWSCMRIVFYVDVIEGDLLLLGAK